MNTIVLLLTIFFVTGEVKTISAVAPSKAVCIQTGEQISQKALDEPSIQGLTWACLEVRARPIVRS